MTASNQTDPAAGHSGTYLDRDALLARAQRLSGDLEDIERRGRPRRSRAELAGAVIGSWKFVGAEVAVLGGWLVLNAGPPIGPYVPPFDAPPFPLLGVVVGVIAAFTAPLILMSQNRQERHDQEDAQWAGVYLLILVSNMRDVALPGLEALKAEQTRQGTLLERIAAQFEDDVD